MLTLAMLAALTILTGCDYGARRDSRNERASRAYLSAMAKYQAGQLDEAVRAFSKIAADEPANASARFQLGCLLQDHAKDFAGAYCAYREYLLQHPQSDKSAIARDRLAKCEVEMAKLLAERHRLLDTGAAGRVAELQKALKESEARIALFEEQLALTRARADSLSAERDRMLRVVKGTGDEVVTGPAQSGFKEAKELLEEEESETTDRDKLSTEVAGHRKDEAVELSSGSTLLAPRKPEDLARQKAAEEAEAERRRREEAARNASRHPETYVVQEGDTLYRIAVRFYGRMSAWKAIRDANKAVISSDGRVRTGQTIRLPNIPLQ